MKKSILSLLFCAMSLVAARAQVAIDFSQFEATQNSRLRMVVLDAEDKSPLSYASVYIIPVGDTTITNFALAGEAGEVEMEKIVPGKYEVNVELLGYLPYKKVHNIRGWECNIGAVELVQDVQALKAAMIQAVGNAVTVKGDTVVYNASMFRVGENAMLEDLLKRMPGMAVEADGTVTVNGEKVDKITVDGKTFFFNDPAMAVKNLPAKVVEQIKVVDKKKDEAEFSGVGTQSEKETVMDIGLKEDFKTGWFGNMKASGGNTIKPEDGGALDDENFPVFNSNLMVAGYNDKDQLTILANAKNAQEPTSEALFFMPSWDDPDAFSARSGVATTAQLGINYATERVKGFEASTNVAYNYIDKDSRERTSRTAFQNDATDINTSEDYLGKGTEQKVSANIYLNKKNTDKYLVEILPTFYISSKDRNESSYSRTIRDSQEMNHSFSETTSHSKVFNSYNEWNLGVKDLGKTGRSLTFSGDLVYRASKGNSSEKSSTWYSGAQEDRNLLYDTNLNLAQLEGVLTYVEPIAKNWSLQTRFTSGISNYSTEKTALNGADLSPNDYYSTLSQVDNTFFRERVLAQYKKEKSSAIFGIQLDQERNEIYSKAIGIENRVGQGEWVFNYAPYADIDWTKDKISIRGYAIGQSETPNGTNIVPALNISNPIQVTTGNIYLKPSYSQHMGGRIRYSNPKNFSFIALNFQGSLTSNGIVNASWFDPSGVRYAIPVNAAKPGYSAGVFSSIRTPLNKKRNLTLNLYVDFSTTSNTSYQALSRLPGLDKDTFDYDKMMSSFWGDKNGNLFYGGKSGFAESWTRILSDNYYLELQYMLGEVTLIFNGSAENSVSRYSLDATANNNITHTSLGGQILWNGPHGWTIKSNCNWDNYFGYSDGFNDPELICNFKISKAVKALTFSVGVQDLFNQEKSLSRTTNAEFVQDSYNNVLGRFVMAGVAFNFGKMNASNNSKAQDAMWQMIF